MKEEEFVRELIRLFPAGKNVVLGIGDDCAALEIPGSGSYLLAAADQVVENIHYLPGTAPEKIAGKLVRRNVSDVAAMGGTPAYALLSVAAGTEDLLPFHRAVAAECEKYGIQVIGGDVSGTSGGDVFSLSILGFAEKDRLKTRSGAKTGDALFACGSFGRSFPTEWHLLFEPMLKEGLALGAERDVHAMMDVSDGLLKDAARMAEASGLAFELDPDSVPRRDGASEEEALCDGEDYALLFAAPEGFCPPVPAAKIGRFLAGQPGSCINQFVFSGKGFDHLEHE